MLPWRTTTIMFSYLMSRARYLSHTSVLVHRMCISASRLHATGHFSAGRRSRSLRGELQRASNVRGAVCRALRNQERFQRPRAITSHATSTELRAHPGPNATLEHAGFSHDGVRPATGQSQYRQALQPVLLVRQCNKGRRWPRISLYNAGVC